MKCEFPKCEKEAEFKVSWKSTMMRTPEDVINASVETIFLCREHAEYWNEKKISYVLIVSKEELENG